MTNLLDIRQMKIQLRVDGENRTIVHNVSLSIKPGEAVGLVGESGSGKSLTARAIMNVLPLGLSVEGERYFKGRDISAMSRHDLREFHTRDVAMIFQDPRAHINPVRTIGDFMTEVLVTNFRVRRRDAERTAAALLDDVGIANSTRQLRQYPHQLSGGMLQRVMIAAAIATQPDFIIADEPTTALDVTIQAEVVAILNEIRHERGMGMLFITHDLDLAAAMCDRTAVMYAGSIVEIQSSDQLHQHPRHPYTAALARSRPDVATRFERLPVVPGTPLSGVDVVAGCSFASRCPYATKVCESRTPHLRRVDDTFVACHHAEELNFSIGTGVGHV